MANDGEIELVAANSELTNDDPDWEAQVQVLLGDLEEHVGHVKHQPVPSEPGKKGAITAIILALGSAGVFTAAVEVFKSWLGRDKKRSIRIKKGKNELTITGDNISEEMLKKALDVAGERQGSGG
jgi:hypothetical protein